MKVLQSIAILTTIFTPLVAAWSTKNSQSIQQHRGHVSSNARRVSLAAKATTTSGSTWFAETQETVSLDKIKAQILQLGAALDRGQSYNPTSGPYYQESMMAAKNKIEDLINMADPTSCIPSKLEDMEGEWELVLTTVPHGIFRSR